MIVTSPVRMSINFNQHILSLPFFVTLFSPHLPHCFLFSICLLGLALTGMKVVVTGVFDQGSREEMEDLVRTHGGQIMKVTYRLTDCLTD